MQEGGPEEEGSGDLWDKLDDVDLPYADSGIIIDDDFDENEEVGFADLPEKCSLQSGCPLPQQPAR